MDILTEREYKAKWSDMQKTVSRKLKEPRPVAPKWSSLPKIMSSLSHIKDEDYRRIFKHL